MLAPGDSLGAKSEHPLPSSEQRDYEELAQLLSEEAGPPAKQGWPRTAMIFPPVFQCGILNLRRKQ